MLYLVSGYLNLEFSGTNTQNKTYHTGVIWLQLYCTMYRFNIKRVQSFSDRLQAKFQYISSNIKVLMKGLSYYLTKLMIPKFKGRECSIYIVFEPNNYYDWFRYLYLKPEWESVVQNPIWEYLLRNWFNTLSHNLRFLGICFVVIDWINFVEWTYRGNIWIWRR